MKLYLMQVAVIRQLGAPVPAYLVQADDGTNVLIDTGVPRALIGAYRSSEDAFAKMDDDDYDLRRYYDTNAAVYDRWMVSSDRFMLGDARARLCGQATGRTLELAVRTSVPAAVRRELDRRGADVLLARGALPVEVATQLARSAEPGDEVAIATLTVAAEQLGTTDPAASADLAARALELTAADDPRRGPPARRRSSGRCARGPPRGPRRRAARARRRRSGPGCSRP